MPLKWEDQIIGGIDILNDPDGRPFDSNDIWLLSQFADLASIAVKNAELHTQIKQFSQELEQKVAKRTRSCRRRKMKLQSGRNGCVRCGTRPFGSKKRKERASLGTCTIASSN